MKNSNDMKLKRKFSNDVSTNFTLDLQQSTLVFDVVSPVAASKLVD